MEWHAICFCKTLRLRNSSTQLKYKACATKPIVLLRWGIFLSKHLLVSMWFEFSVSAKILVLEFHSRNILWSVHFQFWWARKSYTQYTSLLSREPFLQPLMIVSKTMWYFIISLFNIACISLTWENWFNIIIVLAFTHWSFACFSLDIVHHLSLNFI